MAEIVVGLLGPIIELGKCIAAPIKRQFSYLCCFSSNVQILEKEARNLEDVRHDLQRDVDTHKRDAQVIGDQVNTWLNDVGEIQQKKSELDTEIAKASGENCWSVRSRYSASRRAVKTAAAMKQKRVDRSDITLIAHGPLPTSPAADTLERPTCEFESRVKIEETLLTILKDENIALVGLCGMGGVGKTTLAEKIKNKLKKENIFGELVTAVVSQSLDKKKIQDEIAEKLDLKLDPTSLSARAERLCTRLMDGKRYLLVLDDVWEYLDLKEIGIPCKSGLEGCTILITSRDKSVLTKMDIAEPNILEMETLTKEEARSLFKEKLGICADDQDQFSSLAREIADDCSGLPLAVVSVARALKDEKKISVWRDALQQLRSGNPEDLSDVLDKVYKPLRLSFDYLSSQNAKSIFLLCSLYPEDSNIDLKFLTVIAMGLRMFEGLEKLEQVRDRIEALVDMLKHRYLLLEGWNGRFVRMHDVVRDVAIFISSKVPEEKPLTKCGYKSTWISSYVGGERIEFFKESNFPNLRLFIGDSKDEELYNGDSSFGGMKELNVLFITSNSLWTSLSLPKNLRTLVLFRCETLETISVIGDLWNLEILICCRCNAIKEFPSLPLKSLRLLEILDCKALEKIGSAGKMDFEHIKIIFPKLESFTLQNLQNLRVFYQGIDNIDFPLLSHVAIKDCPQFKGLVSSSKGIHKRDDDDDHNHSLHLFCKQKVSFGNLMTQLRLDWSTNCDNVFCSQIPTGSFTLLEEFRIKQYHSIKSLFSFSIAQNLKSLKLLKISDCKEMVKVIEEEEGERSHEIQHITIAFPKLESLRLWDLPNLRAFYQGIAIIKFPLLHNLGIKGCPLLKGLVSSSVGIRMNDGDDDHFLHLLCKQKVSIGSLAKRLELKGLTIYDNIFSHLEDLTLRNCANIKILFPFSIAQNLDSLKYLSIENCYEMVKVIQEAEEECLHDRTLVFPHLEELSLKHLPKLKTFSKPALGFPKLAKVEIERCPEMGGFNLGSLTKNLERLESLHIRHCDRIMEQVFSWSEIENKNSGSYHSRHITFPNLRNLQLSNLDRLTNIFKFVESIGFLHLTRVSIRVCPNLKSVVSNCSNSGDNNSEVVGKLKEHTLSMWDQISIGSFTTLEYIHLSGCDEISNLFSSSSALNLINLKTLSIRNCKAMVSVIEEAECSHETNLLFPHLKQLHLIFLPQLKCFCEWKGILKELKLPSLERVEIYGCPKMERFNLGYLTTPKMGSIKIENHPIIITGDMNDMLQQRFLKQQSKKNPTLSEGEGDQKGKNEIEEENLTLSEGEGDQKEKDEIEEEEPTLHSGCCTPSTKVKKILRETPLTIGSRHRL